MIESPRGYCFSNAYSYVRAHPGTSLVHGTAFAPSLGKRVEHAWVELPDGAIWDGQLAEEVSPAFLEEVKPVAEHRYTRDEALMAMLSHKEGTRIHTGPWEELRGCKGMTSRKQYEVTSRISGKELERALHQALTEVAESEPAPLMPFVEESEVPSGFVELTPEYRFARFGPHSLVHIVKLASKGGGALCSSRLRGVPVVDRTDVTFMSDRICPRCRQRYEEVGERE